MQMYFSQLIKKLKLGDSGYKYSQHNLDPQLNEGASINNACIGQITFLESASNLTVEFNKTGASAILIPDDNSIKDKASEMRIAWASFENPKLAFAEALEILKPKIPPDSGIHPSAVIGKNVTIGNSIYIGANVFIGDNCKIGDNTVIHPGVVIYEKVNLGKSNELHSNCVIQTGSNLGDNCIIHSNAVIGSEGFGFVPTEKGWRKMPQTGSVIIEDNVEIGCNSNIDRPSVGETKIGSGTKIDNLVQIGHGVVIGRGCAMASQVGIAGGAKIGDGVILAGQVGVSNRVVVGNRVVASSKCGIHTDIGENMVISGFPAIPNKLWLRCSANFKKLPEIAKTLRKLNESFNANQQN